MKEETKCTSWVDLLSSIDFKLVQSPTNNVWHRDNKISVRGYLDQCLISHKLNLISIVLTNNCCISFIQLPIFLFVWLTRYFLSIKMFPLLECAYIGRTNLTVEYAWSDYCSFLYIISFTTIHHFSSILSFILSPRNLVFVTISIANPIILLSDL